MARIVNEAARRFLPLSISQNNGVGREVDGWHTYVLTPVNKDVYAKQYEIKDAEAQTT